MYSFYVFIDEGGNTGSDLLERSQPYFVQAGLIVPTESVLELESYAERLKETYLPKSSVLSSQILNTRKGVEEIDKMLDSLLSKCAIPIMSLSDKTYAIAQQIVETCFDGAYNEKVPIELTGDANAKVQLADQILEKVPREILFQFAQSFRERKRTELESTIFAIAKALRDKEDGGIADQIEGAVSTIGDQCDSMKEVDEMASGMDAINLPYLVPLLNLAEYQARQQGLGIGQVVHDESPQNPSYEHYFSTFTKGKDECIVLNNGARLYTRFTRLRSYRAASDKAERILQLADIICGVVLELAKAPKNKAHQLMQWRKYLCGGLNEISHLTGSDKLISRLYAPVVHP